MPSARSGTTTAYAAHPQCRSLESDVCYYSISEVSISSPVSAGWPLLYNTEGTALGVSWPKGLLLHGPPGCGKTLVTRLVAAEFDAEVFDISAANVFGAYTGTNSHPDKGFTHPMHSIKQSIPSSYH